MKRFSKAFTLAEIMIALTIIGVVAALTIPNVMINTNASHAKTAIKKAVASLDQAILSSTAEDGFDCSETFGTGEQSLYHIIEKRLGAKLLSASATKDDRWNIYANFIKKKESSADEQTKANEAIMPEISTTEIQLKDSEYKVKYYTLSDGMTLIMPSGMESCGNPRLLTSGGIPTVYLSAPNTACIGFIDINGAKGPNQVIGCEKRPDGVSKDANDYLIATPGDPLTCEVKEKSITDVFPIVFYNDKVYPATYAAMTVFMDAQKDK